MQDAASLKSVFPSKEHYSGAMGPVTIAGKEYDGWKVSCCLELEKTIYSLEK